MYIISRNQSFDGEVNAVAAEEEKRLHRCCFSGQRPEKLNAPEEEVKQWLSDQIDKAIAAGYTTFISGCAMGVDIWAGQIVLQKKIKNPALHLIAATPWPGFSNKWNIEWKVQYSDLLKDADFSVAVCRRFHNGVFQESNEWIVNHSSRLIAYYNGAPGGTRSTIDYALSKGIEVITNNPVYQPKEKKRKLTESEKIPYPENLLADIGLDLVFEDGKYAELNEDQLAGLSHALKIIPPREREMIWYRYEQQETLQTVGEHYGLSRERVRQVIAKGVRKLRHPSRTVFIRNGLYKTEMTLKIYCAEEIKKQLQIQKKRYPLMTEEDVVKFAFQGMLGVGHLVSSVGEARNRLAAEMASLEPDESEPLIEKISTEWVRLNLRPAKAEGMSEEDLTRYLIRSAEWESLSFTRQNVYNFCVKLDGSDKMKAAAEKVLDESWLPSHSEQYRKAYRPAYRVLYKNFR